MREFKVGDRVKVVQIPSEADNDMLGLEGIVQESDLVSLLLGFPVTVKLDNQPARFEGTTEVNFFLEHELALV